MHNVCILSGDEWGEEAEDDEDYPPNEQPDIQPINQERDHVSAEPLRQQIAAQISAPVDMVQQLHEHDYIWALEKVVLTINM